ncbi:hypothetical protein GKZ92_20425 [Gordonia sp. 135]|nr:hypothetical protein GKZ92_20425 [Gordonia sp. 135]
MLRCALCQAVTERSDRPGERHNPVSWLPRSR